MSQVLEGLEHSGYDAVVNDAVVNDERGAASKPPEEDAMEDKKKTIRIELTDEQKRQIRSQTGKDAKAIELSAEDLEERVSPGTTGGFGR